MMKLTRPKSGNRNLFYVTSESKPNSSEAVHIVVKFGLWAFCDCRNFMVNRLPSIGTPDFKPCKHGEFVLDSVGQASSLGASVVEALREAASGKTVTQVVSRIEKLHQRASEAFRKF
jgi:hypothetical protein